MVTQCLETYISIFSAQGNTLNKSTSVLEQSQSLTDIAAQNAAKLRARSKRINSALIGSHVAVVIGIVGVITFGYKAPVEASPSLLPQNALDSATTSVDQIAAATVASTVAQSLDLSVENNVQNLAVSLNAKTELAQTDNNFLTKPQIVEQNNRKGISGYKAKQGDTVQSVAAAFGVSEDTIRWANNLTTDALAAGKDLVVPGVTGVVYTVKAGDDVAKLAEKYKADKDRIILYNDLELTGITPGARIVIPDGVLPAEERPGYVASSSRYNGGITRATVYSGNGYAYGYCTWYAYNRRAELGMRIGSNWGNAATWATYARAGGFRVDKTPEAGAVFQNGGGWGGLGHVGVVERVNDDGSVLVSEMNYAGWNRVSSRTFSPREAQNYNYIH